MMTKIGRDLGACVEFFFVASIHDRVISYQENLRIYGFSGTKLFATSIRGFKWSKFQSGLGVNGPKILLSQQMTMSSPGPLALALKLAQGPTLPGC